MFRRLARVGIVLLVPLTLTLAGCAETVEGKGQIAEGASPTAEPTDDPTDSTDFTDSTDSSGPSGDEEPANADNQETWAYTDGFEITISKIETYDGGAGIILDDEFAILMTYHLENASSAPVELTAYGSLSCEGGASTSDAYDSNLPEVTGTLAPGEKKDFQQGWAIQNAGHGQTCSLEYTPGDAYFPAYFEFTAP